MRSRPGAAIHKQQEDTARPHYSKPKFLVTNSPLRSPGKLNSAAHSSSTLQTILPQCSAITEDGHTCRAPLTSCYRCVELVVGASQTLRDFFFLELLRRHTRWKEAEGECTEVGGAGHGETLEWPGLHNSASSCEGGGGEQSSGMWRVCHTTRLCRAQGHGAGACSPILTHFRKGCPEMPLFYCWHFGTSGQIGSFNILESTREYYEVQLIFSIYCVIVCLKKIFVIFTKNPDLCY